MKKAFLLFSAMCILAGSAAVYANVPDTCTPANCPGSGANCCKNGAGGLIYKGKDA